MNQIGDGLGLREIDAAVKKCATRELAWVGQARAVFEQRVEDSLGG